MCAPSLAIDVCVMKYLQVKESFPSKHNLVFTEGTREWFLDNNNVTSAARVWRRLASLRFHRGSNMPPIVSIPEIDIENYCGSCFDFYYAMPDGKLIDFFTLGINFFVSSELKELLEKERVEALFSQARVLINGQEYSSKYYLMAPLDMLDVFDATESTYVCEIDSEGDEYIVSVDNLVLSKKN